jgi:aminocarboxymuconate-semialdehyde decarboxylase
MTSTISPPSGPIIDTHRHWIPPWFLAELVAYGTNGFGTFIDRSCARTLKHAGAELYVELMNLGAQLAEQREAGITRALLSAGVLMQAASVGQGRPAREVARRLNNAAAGAARAHPEDLDFLAVVNPLDRDSVAECERCLGGLGAKGISIESNWDGTFLDAPEAEALWEYAQARGAPVQVHPSHVPIGYRRANRSRLEEVVGRPLDAALSVARMIRAGVFDRYPRLQVVLVHMGGDLLDVPGRPGGGGGPGEKPAVCRRRPGDYLRTNLHVDTTDFSPAEIGQALDRFGADRVLFGTGSPAAAISPRAQIDLIRTLGFSAEDEAKLLWKNARALFKLTPRNGPTGSPGATPGHQGVWLPAGVAARQGRFA